MLKTQFINVSLRGITLICKFLLVFFLAKLLEPAELGLYGLLVATVTYSLYLIGFEFYTYSIRELIASPVSFHASILFNKVAFYAFAYLISMPLLTTLFWTGALPWDLILWYYVLLVIEHANQEFNRILVALSLQIQASIVLFIRSGIWVLVAIALMWSLPSLRNIDFILSAWCIGGVFSCALAIKLILQKISLKNIPSLDLVWIKNGLVVALPMLFAAIGLQGLFTFDRYMMEWIGGLETLGAYVLYAGIGVGIISFLDAGVLVFFIPQVVKAARNNNFIVFVATMKTMAMNVVLWISVLTGLAFGAGIFIVGWLEKKIYTDNIHLLKWILVAVFIFGMSYIPHLGLYAQGRDRHIVSSHLAALFIFIVTVFFLKFHLGVIAVPIALCVAFALMTAWKTWAYTKMIRELAAIK